jgi:hypothetical protein
MTKPEFKLASHLESSRPSPRPGVAKLSVKEAASLLGVSKSLLDKLRMLGGGPQFIKIGSRVLYDVDDLENWVGDHKHRA